MGKIKCDKLCGRGCTRNEYERARRRAQAIRAALGKRWKVYLWDNLGWHHEVISPDRYIRVSRLDGFGPPSFLAYISDTKGQPFVCWSGRASTPGKAVELAKRELRKEIGNMRKTAEQLSRVCAVKP
jgi:hypothetical protein